MFQVNVNTDSQSDGCYSKAFDSLGDELRTWVRDCERSLRSARNDARIRATIARSGDSLGNTRVISL